MDASTPTETLARQLRRWRDERKLTAQGLENRLVEIGSKIDRRAIAKIETGRRGVTLDEWLQLAHALAVPPALLFLDLDSGAEVAIAPKVSLHPWIVWEWVVGEHASPVPAESGGAMVSRVEEFGRARTAVQVYQQEEAASNAVHNALSRIRAAEYTGDGEKLRAARADHVDNLRILADVLDSMIENGMTPPGKPAAWIETILSLDLSKYPDRLQVFQGPPDDSRRAGDDPMMRPVTETDVEAVAKRRRPTKSASTD